MRAEGILHRTVEIVVPFHDVDSMHVVWHGHYVKYLEVARSALLEEIGYGYAAMAASGYLWPVIDVQLRYARSARLDQRLAVRASLVEWQNRLKCHYLISDARSGERLTRASTVQVAVEAASGEMRLASPPALVEAVERHLP